MNLFIVDAFTDRPFTGNPAAVCLLDTPAEDAWMQTVAAEMNLSQTAFVHPREDGFQLRWYTPTVEVPLCGHATLATAHILWTEKIAPQDQPIRFHTKSGLLTCTPTDGWIELDFPTVPASPVEPPAGLLDALGIHTATTLRAELDHLIAVEDEATVRDLRPDAARLLQVPTRGVMVTAPSSDGRFDFVSRFFAPAVGINEDPVCGSSHCCLGPYWASRLGKTTLLARPFSARGGVVRVRLHGSRVILGGQAVTILRGKLLS